MFFVQARVAARFRPAASEGPVKSTQSAIQPIKRNPRPSPSSSPSRVRTPLLPAIRSADRWWLCASATSRSTTFNANWPRASTPSASMPLPYCCARRASPGCLVVAMRSAPLPSRPTAPGSRMCAVRIPGCGSVPDVAALVSHHPRRPVPSVRRVSSTNTPHREQHPGVHPVLPHGCTVLDGGSEGGLRFATHTSATVDNLLAGLESELRRRDLPPLPREEMVIHSGRRSGRRKGDRGLNRTTLRSTEETGDGRNIPGSPQR